MIRKICNFIATLPFSILNPIFEWQLKHIVESLEDDYKNGIKRFDAKYNIFTKYDN